MTVFLKQEINVGDKVVYLMHSKTSSWLEQGKIVRLTKKYVCLNTGVRKLPYHIVKI